MTGAVTEAVAEAARTALSFSGVSVRYGGRDAVRGVSFAVRRGGVTALIGPSGSGKTSLLHAVNRLHELDRGVEVSGRIEVGGQDVRAMDAMVLRTRVGLIFQRPTPFPMSIIENLRFPLRMHGRAEVDARAEAALRQAALWDEVKDRLGASALGLSGGQQQRLCLARALALEPAVLLLDEPCAALDPRSTALVEDTLREISGQTTLLLVTHNLAQARRLATECACLWPEDGVGVLADHGATERIFSEPATPALRDWLGGRIG